MSDSCAEDSVRDDREDTVGGTKLIKREGRVYEKDKLFDLKCWCPPYYQRRIESKKKYYPKEQCYTQFQVKSWAPEYWKRQRFKYVCQYSQIPIKEYDWYDRWLNRDRQVTPERLKYCHKLFFNDEEMKDKSCSGKTEYEKCCDKLGIEADKCGKSDTDICYYPIYWTQKYITKLKAIDIKTATEEDVDDLEKCYEMVSKGQGVKFKDSRTMSTLKFWKKNEYLAHDKLLKKAKKGTRGRKRSGAGFEEYDEHLGII